MHHVTAVEARERLPELIDCVAADGDRVIITRDGQEVAALVHPDDARYLQELEDRHGLETAEAALAEASETGTIPWEQVKAELGL